MRGLSFSLALVALCLLAGLTLPAQAADKATLMMATTTSTQDTGLLDAMKPAFEKATNITLNWTSVGTGKALELGKNCDVDVLLVHAPGAEKKYVEEGFGVDRVQVMYNDFVFIGPAADPAKVKGKSMAEALKAVLAAKAIFISRGDESGTHKMEQGLWKKAGVEGLDKQSWYLQAGQGMLATIAMAQERGGYTLTDRGTYLKYAANDKDGKGLKILVEGDKELLNQYSVIPVNPKRCEKAKYDLAKRFSAWLASPEGQGMVGGFLVGGKPLFTPNAGK